MFSYHVIWQSCFFLMCTNASQFLFVLINKNIYVLYHWPMFSFSAMLSTLTPDHTAKNPKYPTQRSPESSETRGAVQKDTVCLLPGKKKTNVADGQNLLEERLRRLEQEIRDRRASSNPRLSAGRVEGPVKVESRKQRTRQRRRRKDGGKEMKEMMKTERLWGSVSHQMDAWAGLRGRELHVAPQHLISRVKSKVKQSNKKKNERREKKGFGC